MVEKCPYFIYCTGKDCNFTFKVEEKFLTKNLTLPRLDGVCKCGSLVCMKCKNIGHEPLICKLFKEWDDNLAGRLDALNNNWKQQNTKKCPGCGTDIEKNQGCMHMTCAKCKHQFCWLCLGDWKKHGSGTGGYYKCNLYKPNEDNKKGDEYLKRLDFYINRYLEHKRGLEINDEKIKQHLKLLSQKSNSPFFKINTEISPGYLDFYIAALKFLVKCRSFIVYTYPIGFKILDSNESALFAQNQYYLEHAVEGFDKLLMNHEMKELIDFTENTVCLSKKYADIKSKIMIYQERLTSQFKNAKKDFSDSKYQEKKDSDFKANQKKLKQSEF